MTNYRNLLNEKKAARDLLAIQEADLSKKSKEYTDQIKSLTEARQVMNDVQLATQVTIKDFIEEIVSLGLKTVFGDKYGFSIQYEVKRNKSEAQLFITKDGEKFDAGDSCGGGVIDVAAFGLRVALFALADPKPEGVLLLDEPGKWVSKGDLVQKFGLMLKEVSKMMGMQIIMVSHDPALIDTADRAFRITQVNGISNAEEL